MNGDEIIGTAILTEDVNISDGCQYIFLVCSSPGRKTIQTAAIPIVESGKPNPGNRGWRYTIDGEHLNCFPSLLMKNGAGEETFHNPGAWRVKFVKAPMDQASSRLRELNKDLLKDES